MDDAIRAFMAKNGAKGGHAGKGTDLRRQLNRVAAQARWAKAKANPPAKVAPKPKRSAKSKTAPPEPPFAAAV